MSSPVNLKKFRKAKARADDTTRAEANAVKFGRTKAEKEVQEAHEKPSAYRLEQHKREP